VHGLLVSALFPALFSTCVPGSVYVSQNLKFKMPLFVGQPAMAFVQVTRHFERRQIAMLRTSVHTYDEDVWDEVEAFSTEPDLDTAAQVDKAASL